MDAKRTEGSRTRSLNYAARFRVEHDRAEANAGVAARNAVGNRVRAAPSPEVSFEHQVVPPEPVDLHATRSSPPSQPRLPVPRSRRTRTKWSGGLQS